MRAVDRTQFNLVVCLAKCHRERVNHPFTDLYLTPQKEQAQIMSNFKTTDSQIYTNYLTGVEHGNQVEGNLAAAEGLFEDDRTLHEIEVLKKMLAPGYYETFVRKRMTENRDVLNESFFGELDDSLRKLRQAQLSALAEAMKLELRSTGLFTKLWSWIIA